MALIDYASNRFSQNGEDGLMERIFSVIGEGSRLCCEFGAWDGIHFSNTRSLILQGWAGVQIEGEYERFLALQRTYEDRPDVVCLQAMVDDNENSLGRLFARNGISPELDLLSVDIDGLDYYVLETMDVRPRVLCIEASAGHSPETIDVLPRDIAAPNVGQSLGAFVALAGDRGYRLICYSGNAFFLRADLGFEGELPTLSATEAYESFLARLDLPGREWLFLANLGLVDPWRSFRNPRLSRARLGIRPSRALELATGAAARRLVGVLRRAGRTCKQAHDRTASPIR